MLKAVGAFKLSGALFKCFPSQLHILLSVPFCFLCASQNHNSTGKRMSSSVNSKKPFTVFVEGNIGSGKTTFLDYFNKSGDITAYAEPVNLWRDVKGHNLLVSCLSIQYPSPYHKRQVPNLCNQYQGNFYHLIIFIKVGTNPMSNLFSGIDV